MLRSNLARATAALSLFTLCSACSIHTDDGGPATWTITVDWTSDGDPAPSQGQLSGSATLDIAVFPEGSSEAQVFSQNCQDGITTIELPDGRYTGSAHLANGNGQPRTTDVQLVPFDVVAGTDLRIPIDFPANSFY